MKLAWLFVGFSCLVLASTIPTETRAQSDFRVTLLGTASPQARVNRFGPSTLVEVGGQVLLFDAGRGVPIRMGQIKIPIGKIDVLFLTHFHSDHVSGIPDVWLSGWLGTPMGRRKTPFHVIGPTGARNLMTNLEKAYALDISIREADENLPQQGVAIDVEEFAADGVVFERDGVRVTAFQVDHGDVIKPAYGYRLDYKGRSAVISGDTRYNANVIKYGAGVDLLIHEVALARPELMSNPFAQAIIAHHTSPRDCGRVFAEAKPKLAAYTHLVFLSNEKVPEATLDDLVKQTRETYDGPLEVGEDLTSFEIGDTVTVTRWKQ
ncbi:MAG: MBL fold metallo-hydrolase [Bradyrhizobium sp.]